MINYIILVEFIKTSAQNKFDSTEIVNCNYET